MPVTRQLAANIPCIFRLLFQQLHFFQFSSVWSMLFYRKLWSFFREVVEILDFHKLHLILEILTWKNSSFWPKSCCAIPSVQLLWHVIYKTISKYKGNTFCLNKNVLVATSDTRVFTFSFFHHLLLGTAFSKMHTYSDASRCAVTFYPAQAAGSPVVVAL